MKIGIANDLPLVAETLRQTVTRNGAHEVVWVARNGREAVDYCANERPDLILMDLLMPVMNGAQATREIMERTPCPILVVTSSVESNAPLVFEAMGAGALDAVDTPIVDDPVGGGGEELLRKIVMIGHLTRKSSLPSQALPSGRSSGGGNIAQTLIAIGASSGGPQALAQILGELPPGLPASIVIIQHIDGKFISEFAKWLSTLSALPIMLASQGGMPRGGHVYLAGSSNHLVIDAKGTFAYVREPQDLPYRPSVDVFFHSVVQHWSGTAVGVLLTGMGSDGARGLLTMKQQGCFTIAQDQRSCAVYGMPKAARELDAAVEILPLDAIGACLTGLLAKGRVAQQ